MQYPDNIPECGKTASGTLDFSLEMLQACFPSATVTVPPKTPPGVAGPCPAWLQALYTGVPGDPTYDHAGRIALVTVSNECAEKTKAGNAIDRYAVSMTAADGEVQFDYWIGVYGCEGDALGDGGRGRRTEARWGKISTGRFPNWGVATGAESCKGSSMVFPGLEGGSAVAPLALLCLLWEQYVV